VFHMNVVKIDWDVAYVAMVVHVCCKRLSPMFDLFFRTYVVIVFIWMLHMFRTHVASVFSGWMVFKCFSGVFLQVFQTYISSVSSIFRRMLQVLHLDISKVDRGVGHEMCLGSVRGRERSLHEHVVQVIGPMWARETLARVGACWHERRVQARGERNQHKPCTVFNLTSGC
jgi:hypothetical protein